MPEGVKSETWIPIRWIHEACESSQHSHESNYRRHKRHCVDVSALLDNAFLPLLLHHTQSSFRSYITQDYHRERLPLCEGFDNLCDDYCFCGMQIWWCPNVSFVCALWILTLLLGFLDELSLLNVDYDLLINSLVPCINADLCALAQWFQWFSNRSRGTTSGT